MIVPRGGERRPITALFADIVGSTSLAERMDPEEWSEIVGEAVRRMSEIVGRYEGHVDQVLGDGVLAFFGMRIAHEDDPQRAVRAGLEMVEAMRRYSDETERAHGVRLPVRVGVNSGPVVVRDLGETAGRTATTALGDAVNIAARMQAEARPDTVLVTAATHAFVAAVTVSRAIGPVALKGKAEEVDAYAILRWTGGMARPRGVPGLDSPMIGRDAELTTLLDLLPAVRAGRGRAAVIVGEPGIGKSRLIAEVRARIEGEAAPPAWYEARCVSYGPTVPYHLVSGIVEALHGATSAESGDPVRTQDPYLAHLLAHPLTEETSREIARLDPSVLQGRYADALHEALVDATRPGPVTLVCEDVHWADAASVELLVRLLPRLQALPILLVIAARSDRDAPGWALVTAARDRYGEVVAEVRLGPLDARDSRDLVAHLLAIESLPGSSREFILERADGNPFFMEEVIRMLIDRGAIERRDDRWLATRPIERDEIPESIHGLLLARIDRLDPEAREFLRVASVIGRRFPVDLLAEIMARR